MIKGLFCHYLPIYKDVDGNYCSTTLTDTFFERYFCVVDELYIATRVYQINESYDSAHQELISHKNVKILEFPNLSTPKGMLIDRVKAKKEILKIAKEVDLIFVRGGIIALLGVDAARQLNKPYLMECAGCAWDEYWNYNFMGKLLAPYMEYREKIDTKNASHVIYVTERWLQSRYPTNGVSTVASNVMLDDIDEEAFIKRKIKIENFDKMNIKIGTTGGVGNKAKGQQFVIEAMCRLKDRFNITYELVGGGSNNYLRSVAKKYHVERIVIFRGQLTHNEVLKWLDDIDIYIQPSMQEGLPRSLIEAMSRACPAIGSTTAGIPELLQAENIFRRGSVDELVNVLVNIIGSDLERTALNNFNKSKEFRIDLLNERRTRLYKRYLEYTQEK